MSMVYSSKQFTDMTKIEKYQHFLRRKFQELENSYYPLVDDLTQKLHDIDGINKKRIPDLDIHQFSFIKEWQNGDVSSSYVLAILKTLNIHQVADTQLTRRLSNYISSRNPGVIHDYVLPCRAIIAEKSVPLYAKYLEMLVKYFEKLVEIDQTQEPVTWIEQTFIPKEETKMKVEDLTLNQVIRQLDCQVIPFNHTRYYVGDNVICLDEELSKGGYSIHWIFAPKAYIDELKSYFDVTDAMDLKSESEYIKRIVGAALK